MSKYQRQVFCIGRVGVPESSPSQVEETTARHPHLHALWNIAGENGRLFYDPRSKVTGELKRTGGGLQSVAGSMAGLYALKYATLGTAIEGMHPSIRHVSSLDSCFGIPMTETNQKVSPSDARLATLGHNNVRIVKIAGGQGATSVLLLSTGILVMLSEDPAHNGQILTLPTEAEENRSNGLSDSPYDSLTNFCRVLDVAGGSGHFACCDDSGRVYTWGHNNRYGQFGRGYVGLADEGEIYEPRLVPGFGESKLKSAVPYSVLEQTAFPFICAVACGKNHTVALSATKTSIYTFGRGHKGQLGHGQAKGGMLNCIPICPIPRCVQRAFGNEIKSIYCAANADHSLVLFESGKVLCFGDNSTGTCGTGTKNALVVPTFVEFLAEEVDVNNEITTSMQQQSPPQKNQQQLTPAPPALYGTVQGSVMSRKVKQIDGKRPNATQPEPKVIAITTSLTHTVVLSASRTLYSAGLRPIRVVKEDTHIDNYGALGRPVPNAQSALKFGKIVKYGKEVDSIDAAVAGFGFTAFYSRRSGKVYLHGSITGENGKTFIGTGKKDSTLMEEDQLAAAGGETGADGKVILPDDEYAAIRIPLGPNKKVVDVFALNGGLVVLADVLMGQ